MAQLFTSKRGAPTSINTWNYMARSYPRFLFSKVTRGKSTGVFIMHAMKPQVLIKLADNTEKFIIEFYEVWAINPDYQQIAKILSAAEKWFTGQVRNGEIKL